MHQLSNFKQVSYSDFKAMEMNILRINDRFGSELLRYFNRTRKRGLVTWYIGESGGKFYLVYYPTFALASLYKSGQPYVIELQHITKTLKKELQQRQRESRREKYFYTYKLPAKELAKKEDIYGII